MEKQKSENIYRLLRAFDQMYNNFNKEERKDLMQVLNDRIIYFRKTGKPAAGSAGSDPYHVTREEKIRCIL